MFIILSWRARSLLFNGVTRTVKNQCTPCQNGLDYCASPSAIVLCRLMMHLVLPRDKKRRRRAALRCRRATPSCRRAALRCQRATLRCRRATKRCRTPFARLAALHPDSYPFSATLTPLASGTKCRISCGRIPRYSVSTHTHTHTSGDHKHNKHNTPTRRENLPGEPCSPHATALP